MSASITILHPYTHIYKWSKHIHINIIHANVFSSDMYRMPDHISCYSLPLET